MSSTKRAPSLSLVKKSPGVDAAVVDAEAVAGAVAAAGAAGAAAAAAAAVVAVARPGDVAASAKGHTTFKSRGRLKNPSQH
jgi:hypothetical protein